MRKILIAFFRLIFLAHDATCRKLTTSEVTEEAKTTCQNAMKYTYTVQSEMQCHHRCLGKPKCEVLNYQNNGRDNCEVFDAEIGDYNNFCAKSTSSHSKWKSVILKREKDPTIAVAEYGSCKAIYKDNSTSASGVYKLQSGKHYCMMGNLTGCGEGGWTLAMKIEGQKNTFRASSAYWDTHNVYNVENGLKSFDSEEAKFEAFNSISFTKVCIGMTSTEVKNWLSISISNSTLLEIFKEGKFHATSFGRNVWMSLVDGSSLQSWCNREGFNVPNSNGKIRIRLGIISNNENNCATPDTFVGLGSWVGKTSGTRNTRSLGYILIQ